ncbi:MAG: hypothetical protein QOE65_81 [Solirubrobacteraceae bacterium]|jgi:glycosyltransferase domain-containing protein|nr:hypothetical protein [Solirubrobacteraceae bacterium]
MASAQRPLVTVGVPTYNRAPRLRRALQSILAQDYPELRVLVADNASTDDTPAVCAAFAAADARVRVIRHPENRGAMANFQFVIDHAEGEFLLLLGDDDWISPGFVSACVGFLTAHPDHVLAGGRAQYHRDGETVLAGRSVDVTGDSALRRVCQYYLQVTDNAIFYGMVRRGAVRLAPPARRVVGADWLHVASLAAQGKIATLDGITIHRELGGASASFRATAVLAGIPRRETVLPYGWIGAHAARDAAGHAPAFAGLSLRDRAALAVAAPAVVAGKGLYLWGHRNWGVTLQTAVRRPRSRRIHAILRAMWRRLAGERSRH